MTYQQDLAGVAAIGARADAEVAALKTYAAQLEMERAALTDRVADLEAQVAAVTPTPPAPIVTPPPDPTPDPVPVPGPVVVSSTAEQVGIRVFPQYGSGTYGQHDAVLAALGRLGVKRISGLLTPGMTADEIDFYQQAYNRFGIKVWFAVGKPGAVLTDAHWTRVRNLLTNEFKAMVECASGWNEANHQVPGDWSTPTATHQDRLFTNVERVNASTAQTIAVGTPPLWSGDVSQQFADLAVLAPKIKGRFHWANCHLYPHGLKGAALAAALDQQKSKLVAAFGDVPILNSESGYFTPTGNYTGGSNPSTETEQANQVGELIRLHVQRGFRLSLFELLDDVDPGGVNREAHFGLVRTPSLDPATWSDKPAFDVVRRTLVG